MGIFFGQQCEKDDQRAAGIGDIDKFVAEALVTGFLKPESSLLLCNAMDPLEALGSSEMQGTTRRSETVASW